MSETEIIPDEFRCNRSDGKQWRCKRRALEGRKMCETHHIQQNRKLNKPKKKVVTEEVKVKKQKRTRVMIGEAEAVDEAVKKMKLKRGDLQLDLIRMVLKREVDKKKKKRRKREKESEGEELLTRVLPNGVMAIAPGSPSGSDVSGSECGGRVGEEPVLITKRRFRSKNIEPLPVGKMQVVNFKGKEVKKRRCHWCGTKELRGLISCLSCEKEFFCLVCIEKRNNGSREEVERKCPVCRGSCRCKVCSVANSGVTECKDSHSVRGDIDRVLHLHYAVCMLLPVLKEINAEYKVKVENDAEMKDPVESQNQNSDDQLLCSIRDAMAVDSPKRCTRSSSGLRISFDQDQNQASSSRKFGSMKFLNGIKSSKKKEVRGNSLFPLEMTSKLEIRAEEIVSCYEIPEILDRISGCPFCQGMKKESSTSDSHLKEASSRREDTTGNFLYYPRVMDFNLEHFQTHWSKGHPVIVRRVLKGGTSLDWDPLSIFCSYLMNSDHKTGNTTSDMDWFEVEIGVKQIFLGSFRGKAETDTCEEKLKLDGWLSSPLFKEQFPNHYDEILKLLPIPRYMDPKCGLLNIAANLPDTLQTPNFGPCLNISYRSGEEYAQAGSLKKLSFETCDTVDILLHVTETPVSTKQICKIRKLMENNGRGRSNKPMKGKESRGKKRSLKDREAANAQKDRSDDNSSSDSESSQYYLGGKGKGSEFQGDSCEVESLSNSNGAHWDVFQKQDVSKLLEYLKNHSLELNSRNKQVSHPLLEQSYYLDDYHKAKLKEEFDVEPWSFDQCVGEAVIVPSGCPYQIRKNKSCVNAVLKFLSPEHVTESVKRVGELNQLPSSVKTKANKIEVKKMAIHKIREAVKEIRELTSSDSSSASRL